jgi:hypothetical protein
MTITQLILLPVFLHFVLVSFLGARMGAARRSAVYSGQVKRDDIVLDDRKWPDAIRQISNNFNNQFQAPIAWYCCIAFLLITGLADYVQIMFAWAFLAARVLHSYIHIGSNKLPDRFYAFLAGLFFMSAMWVWFAIRLYIVG